MAIRIVLAAFISAILVFAWGFLYWGVFNVAGMTMKKMPPNVKPSVEMKKMLPGDGMYLYPFPEDFNDAQGQVLFKGKYARGPLFRLAYVAEGGPVMPASTLVKGFALDFAVSLMVASLVAMAGHGLPRFDRRFSFVMLISLFATVWANVGDVIWWHHTPAFCLGSIAYGLGAGLLMGVVIGKLVSTPAEATKTVAAEE